MRQTGSVRWKLIVVDDFSPVPARDELRELIATNTSQIRVLEQANAGGGRPDAIPDWQNVSDDTEIWGVP